MTLSGFGFMSAVEGMLVGNWGITSVIYQLISLLSYWMAARCATEVPMQYQERMRTGSLVPRPFIKLPGYKA